MKHLAQHGIHRFKMHTVVGMLINSLGAALALQHLLG